MRNVSEITRRRAVTLALSAATLWAVSCRPETRPGGQPGTPGTAPTGQAPSGAMPSRFKEAPMLAELVKQGKLPPVEERLPKEPMVIMPIERIGQYGGRWRTGTLGAADTAWFDRTIGYESLVRWDPEWKTIVPDIAKKYEVSPDGTEFTFYLREGMKWSDGEPFTADDFVFWYEDVLLNQELTPVKPSWFITAGQPGRIEKVDTYTFKMKFTKPNGLLLKRLCMLGVGMFFPQAKYAKQFHIKYNKEAVERMVKEQNLPDWATLYQMRAGSVQGRGKALWYNADVPTLLPWVVTTPLGQGTRVVARRNPFYWKVDPEGNQLPYLDEVVYDVVEKPETLVLKALNGEIDMMDRHIATLENKSVFVENKDKGQYDFFTTIPDSMNTFIVLFNFNHKDPVLRDIIHNKKFRIALSHAINRKEIIDVLYFGLGKPWQAAPRPESPHFHERLATQYLDYDVARANQLLDEIGLGNRDREGFRLRPDGKRLSFTFEVLATSQSWIDTLELIKKYWRAVGVNIDIKPEDRSLRQTRVQAWEHDVTNWGGDGGIDPILGPYWYLAYASFNCFAPAWARWWETGGKEGEEPPPPARRQQELYEQIMVTPEESKQKELMRQILDIAAEEFWIMGISLPVDGYGIVRNNFKNVPKKMFSSGQEYVNPGATMPEQYFIAR
jgi:ABC-type transport system substrate-binding protein